jgi:hypothetical protein
MKRSGKNDRGWKEMKEEWKIDRRGKEMKEECLKQKGRRGNVRGVSKMKRGVSKTKREQMILKWIVFFNTTHLNSLGLGLMVIYPEHSLLVMSI